MRFLNNIACQYVLVNKFKYNGLICVAFYLCLLLGVYLRFVIQDEASDSVFFYTRETSCAVLARQKNTALNKYHFSLIFIRNMH